jgi:hypothetical protein
MAVGACRRLRHVASIAANFEEPTTRKFQSVVVARTQEGLSIHEIGEWAEGACGYGPWVACTRDHLITAVRFLIVQRRLADLREEAPEVDTASVEQQARTIRTSLGRIKTVKTKLTAIDACSGSIGEDADRLREEVRTALSSIEAALRVGCSEKTRGGRYEASFGSSPVELGDTKYSAS